MTVIGDINKSIKESINTFLAFRLSTLPDELMEKATVSKVFIDELEGLSLIHI